MDSVRIEFVQSISELSDQHRNDLNVMAGDYPFLQFNFLSLLETSGVVGEGTGWKPHHCVVFRDEQLIGFMPLYFKYHSYGEYVFDHSWADAYFRYGFDYFPKLVSAIPFTPITGPRVCIRKDALDNEVMFNGLLSRMVEQVKGLALSSDASSFHCLFPTAQQTNQLNADFDFARKAVHFQWQNRGYQSFDHFLEEFSSRKRKNVRKERKALVDKGIEFEVLSGDQIQPDHWRAFYKFYVMTYAKRSGHGGYLNKAFFDGLTHTMADQLVLVLAKREGRYIAGALNFRDSTCLYGRYWGAIEHHEFLHFEACYYQGIDYCIAEGLKRFDPGVQGEHKIQRGFEPVYTHSLHWIRDDAFRVAIAKAVNEETVYIDDYYQACRQALPFKKASG